MERGFVVETVCTLPPGHFADAITSDGHAVSFWERPSGRVRFGWDGQAQHPTLDGIAEMRDKSPGVFCSGDGAHVAYLGMRDERIFVGRDGTEDPPVESVSRSVPPVFSRDGRHLAYGGGSGDEFRLILDGQSIGDCPLAPLAAVFSPDGERLAYAEMRGEKRPDVELRLVLDGVPAEWFPGIRNAAGAMQFSPDSGRFAYCRMDGDLHVQWVIDGVAQQSYDEVLHLGLAQLRGIGVLEPPLAACFSPDSRRFAYFADVPEKGVAMVEDNVAGPVVKGVGWPVFSSDSAHLAYTAKAFDDRLSVVLDGSLGPLWAAKDMTTPVFSPDGRHVAVALIREERGFLRKRELMAIAVDGRVILELQGEDVSARPAFSPDGERVAWWIQQDKARHVYVNEAIHAPGLRVESDPVYTASGRLVYVARLGDGRVTVAVDGQPGVVADDLAADRSLLTRYGRNLAPPSDVPFATSLDGEHVAWAGRFGDEWRPVLDDRVGPGFLGSLAVSFGLDGRATWYFQREGEVSRVSA